MENQKTQYSKQLRFLKNNILKLDAFGTAPQLSVKNEKRYQSFTGSILSIILFGCVIVSCWIYGKDLIYKEKPYTTFAEETIKHPKRFVINKKSMNFAFGLSWFNTTSKRSEYFYDPSIYTVQIIQDMEQTFTDKNGKLTTNKTEIELKVKPCELKDLEIDLEFWKGLSELPNLSCIEDYQDVFIEGNHGQHIFSEIEGNIYPCKNETSPIPCKPPNVIDEVLKDTYWGFYMTDAIVNPTNYQHPFNLVGRSQYGIASNKQYRKIDFHFKNVEIRDNSGVIFDDINTKRGIQFDQEKELLKYTPQYDDQFLKFSIRFSSVRHSKIFRTYLNMAEVIAKVGGVLKLLMLAFFIITGLVTQREYDNYLIKSVFQYNKGPNNESNNENYNNVLDQQENQKQDNQPQQKQKNRFWSFFQRRKQQEEDKIKLKEEQKRIEELKEYAIFKIKNLLNLENLIIKLFDIEKLKLLLLNDDQRKVFNLIEKPFISNEIINGDYSYNLNQKKKSKTNKQNQEQEKEQDKDVEGQTNHQWQAVYQDTRSDDDRQKEGLQSYNQLLINNTINPSYINSKLISLIDPTLAVALSKKHDIELQNQDSSDSEESQQNQEQQNVIDSNRQTGEKEAIYKYSIEQQAEQGNISSRSPKQNLPVYQGNQQYKIEILNKNARNKKSRGSSIISRDTSCAFQSFQKRNSSQIDQLGLSVTKRKRTDIFKQIKQSKTSPMDDISSDLHGGQQEMQQISLFNDESGIHLQSAQKIIDIESQNQTFSNDQYNMQSLGLICLTDASPTKKKISNSSKNKKKLSFGTCCNIKNDDKSCLSSIDSNETRGNAVSIGALDINLEDKYCDNLQGIGSRNSIMKPNDAKPINKLKDI